MLAPLIAVQAFSQNAGDNKRFIQLTGGLGVCAHADPTLVNYINQVAVPTPDQRLSQFSSASEFFLAPEVQVSEDWSIELEYSYFLKSYNALGAYQWDFSYNAHLPTLIVHYLSPGDGYWLKFGGGVGYAFAGFTERLAFTGQQSDYSTAGPTVKVEAIGNTEFDEHFWGSIGIDLRWVFGGLLGAAAVPTVASPRLDFFAAGIKFGVMFQL